MHVMRRLFCGPDSFVGPSERAEGSAVPGLVDALNGIIEPYSVQKGNSEDEMGVGLVLIAYCLTLHSSGCRKKRGAAEFAR